MKKPKDEYTAVVVADMHCGSAVGLLPPFQEAREFLPLFIEGPKQMTEKAQNKGQQYLYECWLDAMSRIPARFDALFLNGDIQHGPKHPGKDVIDLSLVSPSEQATAAYTLLAPLRKRAKLCYVVAGSHWHEGQYSDSLQLLAEKLQATKHPVTGDRVCKVAFPRFGNVVLDIAHKLAYSTAYRITALEREINGSRIDQAVLGGPPDLIIRSHTHYYGECQNRNAAAINTPCWELAIELPSSACPSRTRLSDIGLVVLKIRPKLKALGKMPVSWEIIRYPHPQYETIDIAKELKCQSRTST